METFFFIEPSGDSVEAPTVAQVVTLLQSDEDYWGPYSPLAQLIFSSPPSHQLLLIRHPRRGWYLQHTTFEPRKEFVAIDPSRDGGAWVEHWASGDISYFLAACFLPLSVAEKAVQDFFASPVQPSPAMTWEPFHGLVHWRELPPDDETAIIEMADPED